MKLIFTIIGLVSCAFAADSGPVAPACGPDAVRFGVKTDLPAQAAATAEPGKALVNAIEDSSYDATVRVGLDGAWVGANRGDSWFSFLAEPGDHHLCADWQPGFIRSTIGLPSPKLISLTSFHAEAGNVYYFRVRISNAWVNGTWVNKLGNTVAGNSIPFVDLTPIDRDEGRYLTGSYGFSTFRSKK